MTEDEDSRRRRIASYNDFYKSMIDLIPPHFYFNKDTKAKLSGRKSDDSDDEGGPPTKAKKDSGRKRGHEGELSNKAKMKRMKLDPTQAGTVTEIQQQLLEQEDLEKSGVSNKKMKKKEGKEPVLKSSTDTLEELQQRLHAKIEAMMAKRKGMGKEDFMAKKKMARRMSKMKLRMKRKAEKYNKNKDRAVNSAASPRAKAQIPANPIYNKEGRMVFSKFDFSDSSAKDKSESAGGKDYKRLLEKVKKQKEKVQKVKEKDEMAGKTLEEKLQWDKVLKKAQGTRVRDDENLLKKAQKRKEKLKEKRRKGWQQREEKVKQSMQE